MKKEFIEWLWRTLITLVIAAGAYFGKEVLTEQKLLNSKIQELQITTARNESGKFSFSDWQKEKSLFDTRLSFVETQNAVREQKMSEIIRIIEKIDNKVSQWK